MKKNYFVHESSYVDENVSIGSNTKVWHFSHIQSNAIIGKNCSIGQNVNISNNVKIGNYVKVQNNVSIYTGVVCEDDVFLGPSMVFTNVINPRSNINRRDEFKKTIVQKGATIGANATIICGNNLGKYSFVGAGSVVTKDVKAYSLVLGNPAKHVGWISEFGHRLIFNKMGIAECEESNQRYRLNNNNIIQCYYL